MLAAAGSAVGLGNIWKFPYITGENGGGAFVLVYLVCIALIGLPIMMTEILIGRRGRQSPINTMAELAREYHVSRAWRLLGWAGVIAGFLILSYYSVIAGWALAYVFEAGGGAFAGGDPDAIGQIFADLTGSPGTLLFWHSLFMVMTVVVVARGVRNGLERAVSFLMPALFVLLVVMVGYAIIEGDFARGLDFLFTPDIKKVFFRCEMVDGAEHCGYTMAPLLTAMGHAFFTLSLGMGAIMVYGSYLPRNASISGSALMIVAADTLVALLAGMAIFPIVFANGLEPGAGPGLIFQTLPIAFGQMPGGTLFGALFFILLTFAAWTSAISLVEPAVAYFVENQGWSRVRATLLVGVICWVVGIGTVLSFNLWSGEEFQIGGKTLFDLLDYLTANIMLPLGGLVMAIFVGWIADKSLARDELRLPEKTFRVWWVVTSIVAPIGVFIVFLNAVGLLSFVE